MAPSLIPALVLLPSCIVPAVVSAFAHPRTRRHAGGRDLRHKTTGRPSVRDTDGDDFDPFLISPLTVGEEGGSDGGDVPSADDGGGVIEALESLILPPEPEPAEATTPGQAAAASDFDPLLSPHAYADGVDAGPTDAGRGGAPEGRVGILLIDHGSRREASNEHIHGVAAMYERRLRADAAAAGAAGAPGRVVRAAHMEIAEPGILDALRDLVAECRATRVVCVPYFLSPGRHSTEDVPRLISEARDALREEGFGAEVTVSGALGTVMPQMLGAIDALVDGALAE